MKLLIFIPARQGSKGIKHKNFTKLNGKPLIDYTLRFAEKLTKKYNNFSIFFSTDSIKYLKYARTKGMKFEYLRPKSLSSDKSDIIDAIFHGIDWLKKRKNLSFDAVLLLQPTSPLRNMKDFKRALNGFKKNHNQSLISVTKMQEHPHELINAKKNNWNFIVKRKKNILRRQQYKNQRSDYYFIDGSFYLAKTNFLKKYKSFTNQQKTKLFILKGKRPPDIDHISDLKITELFLKNHKMMIN